ncbi:MAG: AmmeMemoRadiSam system protein B [Candidatus Fermentibacter sp.]|nr:AmmeMemoRadiSam system protein B [Candidatus Fermentibacter sp.]
MEGRLHLKRQPAVSGLFYPSVPGTLRSQVEGFLRNARMEPCPGVTGLVCPHAGYVYSGSVAGMAYASAPSGIRSVVVLAPCHRYPVRTVSVFGGESYVTPLGEAVADRDLVEHLSGMGHGWTIQAHSAEHAEEVQIPFIQVRWPAAAVTPVLMGTIDPAFCRGFARDLHAAIGGDQDILVVASSDLSHYHPLAEANAMDGILMDDFRRRDPSALSRHVGEGSSEACGAGPILTLLYLSELRHPDGYEAEIVGYSTSASASGDAGAVVGYMAGTVGRRPGA